TLATIGSPGARAGLLPAGGPTEAALVLVRLSGPPPTITARQQLISAVRDAIAATRGASLAGSVAIGTDAFSLLARDLPRLAALGAALALVWLLVFFRRPLDVALAAAPAIFGAAALLGVMSALGWRFNLINMAALPLLAGIGV